MTPVSPTEMAHTATPTRIAVIEPSGRLYGSEFCLLDILDGADSRLFDWTVIMPSGNGFDTLLAERNVQCEFLMPAESGGVSRLRRAGIYLRILARLRSLAPDVLYINQTGSLRVASIYAKWLKLPVVCQVQTLEDARWVSNRPELHHSVKAFICNSRYIADLTNVDQHKKCILYQGLPKQRLDNTVVSAQKKQALNPKEGVTIGILGRIAISKGHYLLLDAAKQLLQQGRAYRFVVIGAGLTQKDTDDFKSAVAAAGMQQHFEFRGYQTDIEGELKNVDLLAIPSIAEPLGRVLFDAAEFGVPVVVADSGGLGEVSRRFEIGRRFTANDSDALANTISESVDAFPAVANQFQTAAVDLFRRLPIAPYIKSVERILTQCANRQLSSEVWLGLEAAPSE